MVLLYGIFVGDNEKANATEPLSCEVRGVHQTHSMLFEFTLQESNAPILCALIYLLLYNFKNSQIDDTKACLKYKFRLSWENTTPHDLRVFFLIIN
mgnify:CR=1 FL=1